MKIIHSIPRSSIGWGGGVEFHAGSVYEVGAKSSGGAGFIARRNPLTGTVEGMIEIPFDNGAHDLVYDPARGCFWLTLWGGPLMSVNPATGAKIKTLASPSKYKYGVCLERKRGFLWVADSVSSEMLYLVDPISEKIIERVPINHGLGPKFRGPSGVVETETGFIIGVQGSEESGTAGIGWIVELGRDGNATGNKLRLPAGAYAHDVGGMSLDPDGFLWVKGGKGAEIYKVDLETAPAPVPPPEPEPPTPEPGPGPENSIVEKIIAEIRRFLNRLF